MARHYQTRRRIDRKHRVAYFDIVEVYTESDVRIDYTEHAIAPVGRTHRELITILQEMLRDALRYPVLKEEVDAEARQAEVEGLSTPTAARKRQLEREGGKPLESFRREVARRKEDGE